MCDSLASTIGKVYVKCRYNYLPRQGIQWNLHDGIIGYVTKIYTRRDSCIKEQRLPPVFFILAFVRDPD